MSDVPPLCSLVLLLWHVRCPVVEPLPRGRTELKTKTTNRKVSSPIKGMAPSLKSASSNSSFHPLMLLWEECRSKRIERLISPSILQMTLAMVSNAPLLYKFCHFSQIPLLLQNSVTVVYVQCTTFWLINWLLVITNSSKFTRITRSNNFFSPFTVILVHFSSFFFYQLHCDQHTKTQILCLEQLKLGFNKY